METATKASLWFVTNDPIYEVEKPFLHNYRVHGTRRTNLSYQSVDDIDIEDMRLHPGDYNQKGFAMVELDSCLNYQEFKDRSKVEGTFLREVRSVMRNVLGTEDVFVIEYKIRRRPLAFPYVNVNELESGTLPVLGAHCDYSGDDAIDRIRYVFGDKADTYLDRPFQLLNLWKPLKGPVRDCPLAVCDPSTIDQRNDVCYVDLVDATHVGELANVYYSPTQRWYYISNQESTEAMIFKGYDSRQPEMLGVPHCAFMKDADVLEDEVRESIEVRAVAFF